MPQSVCLPEAFYKSARTNSISSLHLRPSKAKRRDLLTSLRFPGADPVCQPPPPFRRRALLAAGPRRGAGVRAVATRWSAAAQACGSPAPAAGGEAVSEGAGEGSGQAE